MGQAVLADCGALAGTITGIRGCIYDVLLDDGESALDLHWSTIYTVDGAKQGRLTYEKFASTFQAGRSDQASTKLTTGPTKTVRARWTEEFISPGTFWEKENLKRRAPVCYVE
jgi:hypothetical protein